jgi:hypothetical protein
MEKLTTKTYSTAKVYRKAGWITRKEVEEMLQWFKQMEHANKMAMKQTQRTTTKRKL